MINVDVDGDEYMMYKNVVPRSRYWWWVARVERNGLKSREGQFFRDTYYLVSPFKRKVYDAIFASLQYFASKIESTLQKNIKKIPRYYVQDVLQEYINNYCEKIVHIENWGVRQVLGFRTAIFIQKHNKEIRLTDCNTSDIVIV